jgi:hypothetical protein
MPGTIIYFYTKQGGMVKAEKGDLLYGPGHAMGRGRVSIYLH